MAIERYDVSNDRKIYESWPDLVLTEKGKLISVFCECNHHDDRSYSRIVYVESLDRGKTWSAKMPLTEATRGENWKVFWDCPRISRLKDGRLAVLCNKSEENSKEPKIFMWFGDSEGTTWTEPTYMGANGIVPDKLLETASGRWIVSCHIGKQPDAPKLQQRLWYSDDKGATWSAPVVVGKDPRYNLCEGSILEVEPGKLVCFMRENSSEGHPCIVAMSTDNGESWGELYTIPLACCHRPVSGFLSTGEIMITYRHKQGGKNTWLGKWTQNTFLSITDVATVTTPVLDDQWARIMPLNYDPSPQSDLGYTGWVQFPDDGMIYIVDYIRGKEEKCHIIGCSLYRDDIGGI